MRSAHRRRYAWRTFIIYPAYSLYPRRMRRAMQRSEFPAKQDALWCRGLSD